MTKETMKELLFSLAWYDASNYHNYQMGSSGLFGSAGFSWIVFSNMCFSLNNSVRENVVCHHFSDHRFCAYLVSSSPRHRRIDDAFSADSDQCAR